MQSAPSIVVRPAAGGASTRLNDFVLAWALDVETRQPRYILELDADHRGKQCDCVCASCDAPLVAVNAAKDVFRKRPHFRHPEGTTSDQCAVLSARMAVLSQFQTLGFITLPRRRMSASARGLSGQAHEAWVEFPTKEVRITEVDFRDRAFALITMDDGRQLRVQLVGTAGSATAIDPGAACIFLEVDDPAVASLCPEELRARLSLLPESLRWCSHWEDQALQQQAELDANALAETLFDAVPADLELPAELDPSLKRETVLHYAVKRILSEARELHVPGLTVRAEQRTAEGKVFQESWSCPGEWLALTEVKLEQRFGRLIPDVTVLARQSDSAAAEPLNIEVTVTNRIDGERLVRIGEGNVPTLEIDLSRCGGFIDRSGLKALVLDDVGAKRWLHHPEAEQQRSGMLAKLAEQVLAMDAADAAKRRALAMPLTEVAEAYRATLTTWLELAAKADTAEAEPGAEQEALQQARAAMTTMTLRGYPEAAHREFFEPACLLSRLLSIEADRGIGYRIPSTWGVLNAICQSTARNRSNHTLFLIAAHVYRPN